MYLGANSQISGMASCRLGIRRRLDNRFEGESDDSPRALELHNRRKNALHAILDGNSAIRVEHWGATDDSRPHEYVELLLSAATPAVFEYAIVPGVTWLGLKLAEKAFDTGVSEAIKSLVARLITKQETKQILDFMIQLPDGTRITVDPPDRSATIEIHFADGSLQSVEYLRAGDQGRV
jgi:hypothetical protein